MSSTEITYRKTRSYKYQLMKPYAHWVGLLGVAVTRDGWVSLSSTGLLTFAKGYCWDGPSGPAIDTATFMRGSLVHDGLYQLIREGLIRAEHRKLADRLLRRICREDGMSWARAWYVYQSVRVFGAKHTRNVSPAPPLIAPR